MLLASATLELSTLALAVLGLAGSLLLLVAKALAVDELKGVAQRMLERRLERAVGDLDLDDPEQASRYLEEWSGELEVLRDRPFSALRFYLGLRRIAPILRNRSWVNRID